MAIAYIGIGSNIGNKKENFKRAISLLRNDENIELVKISDFYCTKPVGGPVQDDYLNGVLKINAKMEPEELFEKLKWIEKKLGRKKTEPNGPRIIDLDILIFNDLIVNKEHLTIPHPRMHKRMFVLKGFTEIEPGLIHPVEKKTIKELFELIER